VVKKRNVGRLLKSGCNEEENEEILKLLFKNIPKRGNAYPNFQTCFSVFLSIVLPLAGFFTFANYIQHQLCNMFIYSFYVLFVGIVYFSFRNNRLFINDDFIIRQSGAWDVDNEIIEPGKIQAITTSQLFWHKSVDIGSITIHTAGGNISFQLGNFTTIKQYVNLWLYEMETSDSNWM
jgi:putative membrane protein